MSFLLVQLLKKKKKFFPFSGLVRASIKRGFDSFLFFSFFTRVKYFTASVAGNLFSWPLSTATDVYMHNILHLCNGVSFLRIEKPLAFQPEF